jgi:hypothetical protein
LNSARKTLFWFVALLLVAGGLYFFDQQVAEQEQVLEENLKLFPFTVEAVDEFSIHSEQDGLRVKVIRREGRWWLTEPVAAKGDDARIESILSNIVLARKDRTLFDQADAAKLQELGLENPVLEMTFLVSGDETTILFGGAGPTHNVAYAMFSGDPRVYRIHSDVRAEADKGIYELRDKSLLEFDPVKLRRFEMDRRGQPRLVVEHDEGRWHLLEPGKAKASQENVLEGLFMIKDAEIEHFLGVTSGEQESSDLESYGLPSPRIRISIVDEQRKEPYVLIIGDKDRVRRGYFAVTNRSEEIIVIAEELVNYFLSVKDNWRESQA